MRPGAGGRHCKRALCSLTVVKGVIDGGSYTAGDPRARRVRTVMARWRRLELARMHGCQSFERERRQEQQPYAPSAIVRNAVRMPATARTTRAPAEAWFMRQR